MEFHIAKQIEPDKLSDTNYDLFIVASGYEERSTYLQSLYNIKAEVKIAVAFKEKSKEHQRKTNDTFLFSGES